MSGTPDVSADIREHLHITETSSEEDDEEDDTISDTNSSIESEGLEAKIRGLILAELPTGICYDERMRYHAEVSATTGENVHPEDPRRIYYIYKELHEAGLVADPRFKKSDLIVKTPLHPIVAREATRDECIMVHTEAHYDFVKHTAGMSQSELLKLRRPRTNKCPSLGRSDLSDEELIDLSEDIHMDSIYFNSLSYFSAKLSAGAAIDTCRAVVEGKEVKNAIAVIRPPGHHAEVQSTMGFCLFNNVCIASKVCQKDYGPACRKILILDW
jgi:histone deacetylase 6